MKNCLQPKFEIKILSATKSNYLSNGARVMIMTK